MKFSFIVALTLSTFIAGCSKSEDPAAKGSAKEAAEPKPADEKSNDSKVAAASDNPCELLTESVVRKHFKLADDIDLNQKLSKTPYPHCSYRWSTLTPEEEQKRQQEIAKAAMERAQKKGSGQAIADMAMSQTNGQGSAHLTMTKAFANDAAAVGALTASRDYMEKRAKTKAAGKESDLTTVFEDVEGIGAKAHYSKKGRQLSFAKNGRLYHLGAKSQEQDTDSLDLTKTIAEEILP
jgi:hypothetical protein